MISWIFPEFSWKFQEISGAHDIDQTYDWPLEGQPGQQNIAKHNKNQVKTRTTKEHLILLGFSSSVFVVFS